MTGGMHVVMVTFAGVWKEVSEVVMEMVRYPQQALVLDCQQEQSTYGRT